MSNAAPALLSAPTILGWEETDNLAQLHVVSNATVGRKEVDALEQRIKELQAEGKANKAEMVVSHHFSKGMYARELFIPKGVVLTGKVHKEEHLSALMMGEITVWTEEGMKRIVAPFIFKSLAGTKRAGLAHTDTVWVTFHANPNDEQDPFVIEDELTESFQIKQGVESWPLA